MELTEKTKQSLGIPAAILVAGVIIAGAIIFSNTTVPANREMADINNAVVPKVDIKEVDLDGNPYIGDKDAPVSMAFWSDYQCPFCKKTEAEVFPTLIKDYVETGKLKIVFLDFVFLGQDSISAALFDRAVWELYPEQYFTWREKMFAAQDAEGDQGFGDQASIEQLLRTIAGVNQVKVSDLVEENKESYQREIDADYKEGQKFGVAGTPAAIVGTTLISGARPLSSFVTEIEKELAK